MEPQVAGPMGSDFGLCSGRGDVFAVVGHENARPGSYAGPHDDGLEQSAHGLFFALLDDEGVEAPGGAPLSPSVDAAECSILAGAGRPMMAGSAGPAIEKTTGRTRF
jgi:hypothetical protein